MASIAIHSIIFGRMCTGKWLSAVSYRPRFRCSASGKAGLWKFNLISAKFSTAKNQSSIHLLRAVYKPSSSHRYHSPRKMLRCTENAKYSPQRHPPSTQKWLSSRSLASWRWCLTDFPKSLPFTEANNNNNKKNFDGIIPAKLSRRTNENAYISIYLLPSHRKQLNL